MSWSSRPIPKSWRLPWRPGRGHSPSGHAASTRPLQEARAAIGADRLLILPADLPTVAAGDLGQVLAAGDRAGNRSVVLAPDRHGRGTNALLLTPPEVIDPAFGGDSRAAHAWLASSADAAYAEIPGILGLDLDTADDLLLVESLRAGSPSVR